MTKTRIEKFYNNNYKKLLIIPLLLIIFAITTLTVQQISTGSFVDRDVTLQGGISATIYSTEDINKESLETALIANFPNSDISLRELASFTDKEKTGIIIERGSYLNLWTKMDASNYYVQSGDMKSIDKLIPHL